MSADLTTLYDLFEDDKQTIPPMLLGEKQLATIVEAWNDLRDYGMWSPICLGKQW